MHSKPQPKAAGASAHAQVSYRPASRYGPGVVNPLRSGSPRADVAATVAALIASSIPVFLVGALAVQLRESLHFQASGLGLLVALYYLGATVSSAALGRMVEAVGGLRSMRITCLGSAVVLALIGLAARSWALLAVMMVPAGLLSAAMQPATNQFLARRVTRRQGLAFGIKQAAVPLATALAGLSVPFVALIVGWRWAFLLGAAWAITVALLLPRPRRSLAEQLAGRSADARGSVRRAPLAVLTIGFGIGVAAASALAAFLVSSAVALGMARGTAGLLAALGGLAAVTSRIVTGVLADRRGRAHLPVVAGMLGLGALGYGGLALAAHTHVIALLYPAVVLTFAAGWGWNGLFNFAVVRTHLDHPGRATGITQTGGRFGGMLGPFLFGELATHGSYATAWLATMAAALVAAMVILVGRNMLRSALGALDATPASERPSTQQTERSVG